MWEKITFWIKYFFFGCAFGLVVIWSYNNYDFIIKLCNDNEGFFSAALGFLAIIISIMTYYNQKKEQAKNAQENSKLQRELDEKNAKLRRELDEKNAKLQMELEEKNANLQRELTEQSNKLQADIQIRQIKLDSYNLRYNCWNGLQFLDNLLFIFENRITVYKKKNPELCYQHLLEVNNEFKIRYNFKDIRELLKISFILKNKKEIIEKIVLHYSNMEIFFGFPIESLILNNSIEYIEEFFKYREEIKDMIQELEKDLDISEIHKF